MRNFFTYACSFILLGLLTGCAASSNNGTMGKFERSLSKTEYGYKVIEDPTGTAPTKHVDRFEVRAGDCTNDGPVSQGFWDDCPTWRERSELAGPKEARLGKEEWYGWYIYIPQDWKDIEPAANMYGQFFQLDSNVLIATRMSNQGLQVQHFLKDKFSPHYDIDLMRGKWTKVEMHIKWEKEIDIGVMPDGFANVYVNGTLLYSYKGNTVSSYGNDKKIYFKYGIYRYRLNNLNGRPAPTQISYYSGVSRATTREGLFVEK